jgi:hypothetical protein
MTNWGPGAIPPGYMLAPDGTLVPIPPVHPHAPAGSPPAPYAYGPGGSYAMVPPPAPPTPFAPPAVSVSITVSSGPVAPGPMPSGGFGYPSGAPVGYPAMSPAVDPRTAAVAAGLLPAPYAPAWSEPSEGVPHGLAPAPNASLALAREEGSALPRERHAGDAGSLGALSIATSGIILASALATVTLFVVPVGAVLASAAVASGITGGMGLWLLRQRRRARGKVDLDPDIQVRLLDLAAQKKGRLTVTAVAQGLGLTLDESERALQAMSRSNYVDVELDPDVGVVTYVFRELVSPPAQLPADASGGPSR